jgi:hypothetical protein
VEASTLHVQDQGWCWDQQRSNQRCLWQKTESLFMDVEAYFLANPDA